MESTIDQNVNQLVSKFLDFDKLNPIEEGEPTFLSAIINTDLWSDPASWNPDMTGFNIFKERQTEEFLIEWVQNGDTKFQFQIDNLQIFVNSLLLLVKDIKFELVHNGNIIDIVKNIKKYKFIKFKQYS